MRVTVPEGHVAVILPAQTAEELKALCKLNRPLHIRRRETQFVALYNEIELATIHALEEEEIREMIARIEAQRAAMSPEDRAELERLETDAQRESWIRAMRPCEHGVHDFEDCEQCRTQAQSIADEGEGK